jgi:hypothetical protein
MSDNTQDTRLQDGVGATESIGRSPGRGGATRRSGTAVSEAPQDSVAVGGEMSRHLREAPGAAIRRATMGDQHTSVAESATPELKDLAPRLADAPQASARGLDALFALRRFNGGQVQQLGETVGTVVENMMRELFRMTSPVAAIDLQRRYAAEYLDTMLHGTATLFRSAHRTADHALRPLEEHVAQRRKRRPTHPNAHDEGSGRVADVMRTAPPVVSPEDTVQRAAQLMRDSDLGGCRCVTAIG